MSGRGSSGRGTASPAPPSPRVPPDAPARDRRPRGPHLGPLGLTPTRVVLAIALVSSVAFVVYAFNVRDASQIPLLAAGAIVLAIVFGVLALAGMAGTYAAARDGRSGRALMQAVAGGVAVLIAFGCVTVALILILLRSPATPS